MRGSYLTIHTELNKSKNMDREERIAVFKDTVKTVNEKQVDVSPTLLEDTQFYYRRAKVNFQAIERKETEITVENIDCLLAAEALVKEGYNVAVLNMASFARPGGGALKGSAAQEENLSRRTDLFASIFQFHDCAKEVGVERNQEFSYPLNFLFGAVYSPNVTVFKGSEADGYPYINPFKVDVISVAAIKDPKTEGDGKLTQNIRQALKTKVKQMFNISIINGRDALVLGAFGCGAYKTPPREMAEIFKEVLEEEDYKGAFSKVVFAIIEDRNAFREHNPQGNLKPFLEVFKQ